ncbi:MAG: NAD(P)H-binding protein, partial [Anaerolineae bacterium]|nr:NAD(P)H-binding protein [Anaerolineae bacterium]
MQIAQQNNHSKRILVTGVTGYIGGRLVPLLLEAGYQVRVLVRGSGARLEGRPWLDRVEVAVGDVLEPASLSAALQGVDAAYYLIHSMSGHTEFSRRDREAAQNFAGAAEAEGVSRIIYLGGLGDPDSNLSEHLRSRQETGATLAQFQVPVTEFRAGMVVGSGSLSFEMLRHLTERLPVMIAPRWVYTKTQPIAVGDVLNYLVAALETPASAGKVIQIGGANVLSNAQMMLTYARIRGLRRLIIPVPVLTPRL